jgi:pimeloyl-ACP methyl ester carboxylesterase
VAKQDSAQQALKYSGEFFRTPEKRHEEVIFFVHFYGGSKRVLQRHIKFVNSEGYDAFAFELISQWRYGFKRLYANQIEELLDEIPGQKIVYAFSNPSAGAIEALSRRKCRDISALICDSGPSGKFIRSFFNLYRKEHRYSFPVSLVLTAFLPFLWGPRLNRALKDELKDFPSDFPVLSIIGGRDTLIPPDHIEAVFENQPHLRWRKLVLPECGHLSGLRDFPNEYKDAVNGFFREIRM